MPTPTLDTLRKIDALGIEGQLVVRGYLQTIFDRFANKNDWKAPINASVNKHHIDADMNVVMHAILFFTGNPNIQVTETEHSIVVVTPGYRAGPCGG